jgi:Effector-associated domain 10
MMNSQGPLESIFERLATGEFSESDIQFLRNSIRSNDNPNLFQVGNKYAVNIGQSTGDIHIGDNITYQGLDANAIRAILREVRAIQNQQPLASNSEFLQRLRYRNQFRELPGVPFQGEILGCWGILSFTGSVILIMNQSSSNSLKIQSLSDFLSLWMGLYFISTAYGFLGIFLQGIFQYRWRFSDVRQNWTVWFFYPIIVPFFIAFWFVFSGIKNGGRISSLFRFWR